jgi:sec-independent protein translocase protein TatC
MEERMQAVAALDKGSVQKASELADQAAMQLGEVDVTHAQAFTALWKLERHIAQGQTLVQSKAWTHPMLAMDEQLTLVLTLLLAMGMIFELPLVMALLASLGLVRARFLMKYQRHALVVCLIIAAIVTPTGDAVNLSLMAGPMVLCYELGVLAAWLIEKRRAAREQVVAAPTAS